MLRQNYTGLNLGILFLFSTLGIGLVCSSQLHWISFCIALISCNHLWHFCTFFLLFYSTFLLPYISVSIFFLFLSLLLFSLFSIKKNLFNFLKNFSSFSSLFSQIYLIFCFSHLLFKTCYSSHSIFASSFMNPPPLSSLPPTLPILSKFSHFYYICHSSFHAPWPGPFLAYLFLSSHQLSFPYFFHLCIIHILIICFSISLSLLKFANFTHSFCTPFQFCTPFHYLFL